MSKLDYEAHVTIEPVEGASLTLFESIAKRHGFRVANLLMVKDRRITSERSNRDSFATGWGETYSEIAARCMELVEDLKVAGLTVWRFKVERTLLDVDLRSELPSGEPRDSGACSILNEETS